MLAQGKKYKWRIIHTYICMCVSTYVCIFYRLACVLFTAPFAAESWLLWDFTSFFLTLIFSLTMFDFICTWGIRWETMKCEAAKNGDWEIFHITSQFYSFLFFWYIWICMYMQMYLHKYHTIYLSILIILFETSRQSTM